VSVVRLACRNQGNDHDALWMECGGASVTMKCDEAGRRLTEVTDRGTREITHWETVNYLDHI
jgi:hypothetical protein